MSILPAPKPPETRFLTAAAFQGLADVPPEMEWFANLGNHATRRAYETALKDFMRFTGIGRPEEFRIVTRAHVIAWRDALGERAGERSLIGTSSWRRRRSDRRILEE